MVVIAAKMIGLGVAILLVLWKGTICEALAYEFLIEVGARGDVGQAI